MSRVVKQTMCSKLINCKSLYFHNNTFSFWRMMNNLSYYEDVKILTEMLVPSKVWPTWSRTSCSRKIACLCNVLQTNCTEIRFEKRDSQDFQGECRSQLRFTLIYCFFFLLIAQKDHTENVVFI